MSEIVILSDSDNSESSIDLDYEKKKSKNKFDINHTDDFEFPEVNFYQATCAEEPADNFKNKYSYNTESSKNYGSKSRILYAAASENHDTLPTTSQTSKRCNNKKSTLSESVNDLNEENSKGNGKQKKATIGAKKSKTQIAEDRQKRLQHLAREKALKEIARKKSKNIQPDQCIKFMKVVIDKGIQSFGSCGDIITTLLDANVQYSINTNLIPNSVTWKRTIEENYINEDNEICTNTKVENINQTLIIWNWDEVVAKVEDGSFCASISSIKSSLPECNVTLLIFGIEDYFICKKHEKNSTKNGTKNKKNNAKNSEYKNSPDISQQKLETCLNEIQIIDKCNSRLINNSQELALVIYQYTKAIAEMPYKLEKSKSFTNKFDWYVMGDNKNTVRVDKDGNGLKRLWQQQLCQFTLSSLEIAEAICSVYSCPADLAEAYMNSTHDEGMNLLKDIPIRRAAGPLTASRKVGPELSKKVYIMFTSEDGESVLS